MMPGRHRMMGDRNHDVARQCCNHSVCAARPGSLLRCSQRRARYAHGRRADLYAAASDGRRSDRTAARYYAARAYGDGIDANNGLQMVNGNQWIIGQFEGATFHGQLDVPRGWNAPGCTYMLTLQRTRP